MTTGGHLSRLSLNQITTRGWGVDEAIEASRTRGLGWIGLWRDKVADFGLEATAKVLRDNDIRVSSLCRAGFFAARDPETRAQRADDNRAAVDEAAALGTDVLVLVCGGLDGVGLDTAREMVADGIDGLAPYAQDRGVRLAIEPLHPMFAADRSVVVTLAQALDLAEQFPAEQVGVVVDAYHLWWDPHVYDQIRRASRRILSYQVCDWIVPLPDTLLGRGMMGDGSIDLRRLREAVDAAGYDGPIEVEIFNQAVWDAPGDETFDRVIERYVAHVL